MSDSSSDELSISSNGNLLLTYKDGKQDHCGKGTRAQTQITLKCGERTANPKLIEFVKSKCIYKLESITFMARPVNHRNGVLLHLNNGYLEDKRINALINIESLIDKTFNVNQTDRQENYIYVINVSKPQFKDDIKCSKAAICQTKPNSDFKRDIGSIDSIKYYLKGHELQIVLISTNPKKCGKNKNKNVTSIIRLQCSSSAGLGEPYFVYESNDCDYVFNWETEIVCPKKFVDFSDNGKDVQSLPNDQNSKQDKSQSRETAFQLKATFESTKSTETTFENTEHKKLNTLSSNTEFNSSDINQIVLELNSNTGKKMIVILRNFRNSNITYH